jgi:hypothetical protein
VSDVITPGAWVQVRCADGSERTKRALTFAIGAGVDFPVAWVCDPEEYYRERRFAYPPVRGQWDAAGRPWPLEDVSVVARDPRRRPEDPNECQETCG